MGNSLSAPGAGPPLSTAARTSTGTDSILGELGAQVQYEKSMGNSRFLKTIRARHKQGALVVKVFAKADPSISLKPFNRRIKAERENLIDCPNVLGYQRALETERGGYLIRQWVASNLYDRISTRPFLSSIEKKWIAFQLLTALAGARERGVAHGDIKTENILVTSWNWVYLTDFASFKPVYLPLDDPSTFSYFFDTSSRRTCYLAPERFYAPDSDIARRKADLEFGKRDGRPTEAMDVFALGCVLAELWMEGTPPFSLSQLFKYRAGEYSPEAYLAEIEDVEIRNLIRSMISLDPDSRLSCAEYLANARGQCLPEVFYTFLHPFLLSLNDQSPPPAQGVPSTPSSVGAGPTGPTARPSIATAAPTPEPQALLRTDADDKIERVWNEWEMITGYLDEGHHPKEDRRPEAAETSKAGRGEGVFPIRLHIPGLEGETPQAGATEDGPALVLLSLLCANIRNCLRPGSILRALDVLLALSGYLTDETKLDRLVPYLIAVLQDDNPAVRSGALKTLTQTLATIHSVSPSNASVFPEYILPNTRPFANDPELLPRVTYAQCVTPLARTAARFLDITQAAKSDSASKPTGAEFDSNSPEDNYDHKLAELHAQVQEHIAPLLADASPVVKRALLEHVATLCTFFGRRQAADAVLAHLVTYLNTRDWQLRRAWNEHAVEVAVSVGRRALEEYILPLIVLSLADAEEFVVAQVLATLSSLADKKLLAKGKVWELANQAVGFLCHPNIWIREGAAAFLTSVANTLQETDRWCILYPQIKRLLRNDVKEITALNVLDNAREPLPRVVFEAAVGWAGKPGRSNFWSIKQAGLKSAPVVKGAARDASVRTDEDHAQLEKLRKLGMKAEDEYKLVILKEYISKLAASRQASSSRFVDPSDSLATDATLGSILLVPQTIIFSIKPVEEPVSVEPSSGYLTPRQAIEGGLRRRFSLDPAAPRSPGSMDHPRAGSRSASGQPIDDLRRRLALAKATTNVSPSVASSVHDESGQAAAADGPIVGTGAESPTHSREPLERTTSRTSTATDLSDGQGSTAGAHKSRSRVHLNAVEVGRATPTVAESSSNVMGLFNVDARYKAEDDAASVASHAVSAAPYGSVVTRYRKQAPSQRFVSTYDGHDPTIKQLLERVFLDSYRDPVPELGPHVPAGIPRRKALRSIAPPRDRSAPRPRGTLVAHLVEHKGAITAIAVAPSQLFFATGSEDGTVKVWDAIRLERNVTSRARQTIVQGGKVTSVVVVEGTHCVASASDNGTVWVHRVDVNLSGSMPKYGKACLVRQYRSEAKASYVTTLASYNTDTTTNLVLGTSLALIVVLNIRTMRELQTLQNPLQHGPVTSVCIDRKKIWLVAGTARGVLSLWDLRFGLLLRSWAVGTRRVHKVEVHPTRGKGRWVVVALEADEGEAAGKHGDGLVEVWDVDSGRKVEEFRAIAPQAAPAAPSRAHSSRNQPATADQAPKPTEASATPAQAIEAFLAASQAAASKTPDKPRTDATAPAKPAGRSVRPGVRTFLLGQDYASPSDPRAAAGPGLAAAHLSPWAGEDDAVEGARRRNEAGGGYLLTAGEDRKLRFWDLGQVGESAVVSGLDLDEPEPAFTAHTSASAAARPALFLESPGAYPPQPAAGRAAQASSSSAARQAAAAGPLKPHRSTLIANSQQQLLKAHQEAITALAVVELPFRCVITGDRSGVVRAFE